MFTKIRRLWKCFCEAFCDYGSHRDMLLCRHFTQQINNSPPEKITRTPCIFQECADPSCKLFTRVGSVLFRSFHRWVLLEIISRSTQPNRKLLKMSDQLSLEVLAQHWDPMACESILFPVSHWCPSLTNSFPLSLFLSPWIQKWIIQKIPSYLRGGIGYYSIVSYFIKYIPNIYTNLSTNGILSLAFFW